MTERKRGRPPAPNPRTNKINIYLTDAEMEEVNRLRLDQDLSGFCRTLVLRGLYSEETRYFHFVDSGQAEAEEAAEWAEAMREADEQSSHPGPVAPSERD